MSQVQAMTKAQPSPLNVSRGLRCAILSGLLGAVAPVALVLGGTVCGWLVSGTSEWDRQADLQELPNSMLDVAIGCATVFACAGWAAYAPLETYRFARSLAIIFSISLLLWFIMITVVLPPRYGLKGRESMVNGLPDLVVIVGAPMVAAWVLTDFRIANAGRFRKSKKSHGADDLV